MEKEKNVGKYVEKMKNISGIASKAVSDIAAEITGSKEAENVTKKDEGNEPVSEKIIKWEDKDKLSTVLNDFASFRAALGSSPLELTKSRVKQIKRSFPVPREQIILWADAEFDLRPSGIVATNKGVFIRTNVSVFDENGKIKKFITSKIGKQNDQNEEALEREQFHSGKAELYYYSWDRFDATWFAGELDIDNKALLVDPKCSGAFIDICRNYVSEKIKRQSNESSKKSVYNFLPDIENDTVDNSKIGSITGLGVQASQSAIFAEQTSSANTPAGHGLVAEEAINILDRIHGLDAKVVGRDNLKNGADRQIGNIRIQTKYYNTPRGSLESSFDPITGQYRYLHDGKPMQLEVPKDQYASVLSGFEKKIKDGKVPSVKNPKEAKNIVREGRLTYKQAVNITKPGTIESLIYDVSTGIVSCTYGLGISFVVTVFLTWRRTGNFEQAIKSGASVGLQVFGLSFLQHMLVSQVARTRAAKSLVKPSIALVEKLGPKTTQSLVNSYRALSGDSFISGASANKHLSQILRNNALASAVAFSIFSIPETYNLASKKISTAQYVKNMSVLAGSIAGGSGGVVVAGAFVKKAVKITGSAIAPGVGTLMSMAGGAVGSAVGGKTVKALADFFHEDDVETYSRLLNAYVSCMVSEYLFTEYEINMLITSLNRINEKALKNLFYNLEKTNEQEAVIRFYLTPHFDSVVAKRPRFLLPSENNVIDVTAMLIEDAV